MFLQTFHFKIPTSGVHWGRLEHCSDCGVLLATNGAAGRILGWPRTGDVRVVPLSHQLSQTPKASRVEGKQEIVKSPLPCGELAHL